MAKHSIEISVASATPPQILVSEELLEQLVCVLSTAEDNAKELAGPRIDARTKKECIAQDHFNKEADAADAARGAARHLEEILKDGQQKKEQEPVKAEDESNEKRARMYYQNIVYSVCHHLDRLGVSPRIVNYGTWLEPSTEVSDKVKELVDEVINRRDS